MRKQGLPLSSGLKTQINELLGQHFDYPDKAVCIRILHVLALLLPHFSLSETRALLERFKGVKSALRFRLLSEVVQSAGLDLVLEHFPDLIHSCAQHTLNPSSSSPAMELLKRLLQLQFSRGSLEAYFDSWKSILTMPEPAPLVLEEALRVCKGQCAELLLSQHPPLRTLVTVLKACRALRSFKPQVDGILVFASVVPRSTLETALTSLDLDLAADMLEVLAVSSHAAEPVSELETSLFLLYLSSAMKTSDPHFRQRTLAACKKLLMRLRLSVENPLRDRYATFITQIHEELLGNLYITAPYELLEPTLVLLEYIYQLFGSASFLLSNQAVPPLSPPLVSLYSESAKATISQAIWRPWDLVRRLCFKILKTFPPPAPADLAAVLPRLASLRVHESEAQAWQLLLCIRTQPTLFDELLDALQQRAELLAQACTDYSLLPHGLMACLRFAIEEGVVEASLARMQQLTTVLLAVARQSSELLSKFTGTDCRGHVLDSEQITLGMWLACKENGLLLAQYSEWMKISPQTVFTVKQLATDIFQVLLALKHRGSIVKTADGLTAYFQRLFREQLTTELPLQLLRQLLDMIRSSEDKALVLRRSAGFPHALLAILQSAPTTAFTASLTELLTLTDIQQQSEVRIHALNILRYVLQDKTLKTKSEQYLGPCLQAGALALSSEDWSVRNSGTLTFAAVLAKALGIQFQLTLTDLEARCASLEQDLSALLLAQADPYPVLLLLQRLAPDGTSRPKLVAAVLRHLTAPNEMVRRVASEALRSLLSHITVQANCLLLDSLSEPYQPHNLNCVHGQLLLLSANTDKLSFQADFRSLFPLQLLRVPLIGETYLQLRMRLHILENDETVVALKDALLVCSKLRFEQDLGFSLTRLRLLEYLLTCSENPSLQEAILKAALYTPSGNLHEDDPEFTQSALKLLRQSSLPCIPSLCLEVLSVLRPSFASCWRLALQILLAHNHLPSPILLTDISLRLPSSSPLQAILVKCMLKAAGDKQETAHLLWEKSGAQEKDFVRSACAEAMGENMSLLSSNIHLWTVVFRLLQDQVEAIRQLTAQTVSRIVAPSHPCNPTVALRLSVAHVATVFPLEQALLCLVNEVRQSCKVQQFEFSQENKKRVFFTEPLNCFQEPKLISRLALSQIQQIFQRDPALKTSPVWLDLLTLVSDLSTRALPEEEAYQIAFVQAHLITIV